MILKKNFKIMNTLTFIANKYSPVTDQSTTQIIKSTPFQVEVSYGFLTECSQGLEELYNYIFDNPGIYSLEVPEGVKIIDRGALEYLNTVKKISLPKSLKIIHDFAFYNCYSLTEINIPIHCSSVSWHAFKGCPLLRVHMSNFSKRVFNNKTLLKCALESKNYYLALNTTLQSAPYILEKSLPVAISKEIAPQFYPFYKISKKIIIRYLLKKLDQTLLEFALLEQKYSLTFKIISELPHRVNVSLLPIELQNDINQKFKLNETVDKVQLFIYFLQKKECLKSLPYCEEVLDRVVAQFVSSGKLSTLKALIKNQI